MKKQYIGARRKKLSIILSAACLCTLMAGCGGTGEAEDPVMSNLIPVQVQSPEAGTLVLKNEFVGTVSPEESVYVIPMVSAEVISTNVSLGEEVAAGDVLCKLDSEPAKLQLASAQAQYDSAAAGVNSAEVGYEAAQAQYESTVAQLEAQMGGQKNLQMYQLQIQVDAVHSGIDDIYEQMADLQENKEDAKEQKDDLKKTMGGAEKYVKQANSIVAAAQMKLQEKQAAVTALEPGDHDAYLELIANYPGGEDAYEYDLKRAKEDLTAAQSDYEKATAAASQASAAYSQAEAAYQQAKAGIDSIEDGQEQLDNALADAYKNLEQTEAIKNITEEQVYSDTQKIVDANKKAAAVGLESAAAGINSAQVGMKGAQVAIDSAEYQLDMYTLKAPISGIIEAVNVEEHGFATPNTPAYIISNKEAMTVTFYVSEGVRNTFSVGQQVTVDRNGKIFDGVITEIGSMVDQNTGLFMIKVSVGRPDESMLTGCSVKVSADTYSQGNVLLIPYDAVYYDNGQPYVYVTVNGIAERRDIETGIFDEQTMTVVSGLTTEDQVITSWSANLREGAEVSIQSEKTEKAVQAEDSSTAETEQTSTAVDAGKEE